MTPPYPGLWVAKETLSRDAVGEYWLAAVGRDWVCYYSTEDREWQTGHTSEKTPHFIRVDLPFLYLGADI